MNAELRMLNENNSAFSIPQLEGVSEREIAPKMVF